MNARAHCCCNLVRCFDYAEAADKLRCTVSWLKDNISTLPHQKRGASPSFCECELALIQAMTTVLPDNVAELLAARDQEPRPENGTQGVRALSSISPAQPRGKRTAS
ncbi:hypothetical protein [Streptomyces sp. NPDC057250]|uniref:hypothetical protein n=1 Tax=Streptomyces sp. NPDC057250 TaxID=3346068 RepID=UPI00362C6C00